MYNPQFPHTCKIYRMGEETPFEDGVKATLYEGRCRKYITRRSKMSGDAFKSEYTLAVPRADAFAYMKEKLGKTKVDFQAGDILEVDDVSGHFKGVMTECNVGNLGINIYWDEDKN